MDARRHFTKVGQNYFENICLGDTYNYNYHSKLSIKYQTGNSYQFLLSVLARNYPVGQILPEPFFGNSKNANSFLIFPSTKPI